MVIQLLTTAATAVVARLLGGASFGALSSAMAVYWLMLAASDFGFGFLLGRKLGANIDRKAELLRNCIYAQTPWAVSLAVATALLGWAERSGGHASGTLLLALAPAVAFSGLAGARQVYYALYQIRRLTVIDIATNAAQVAATIIVAALGAGPIGVAIVAMVATIINAVLVLAGALRFVGAGSNSAAENRQFFRAALPFGVVSFMASIYFTIDLALLGWLVRGTSLGDYAAATKVLSMLVTLPGLVLGAALPGLAGAMADNEAAAALAARIWHWLVAVGLPLCAGTAAFAPQLVRIVFGSGYSGAAPLVRVLAAAAGVALLSNLLGTMLGAAGIIRPLLTLNSCAVVGNITGNLLLVPRYGVTASAWLTLATELFVCVYAVVVVARRVPLRGLVGVSIRPILATGAALATAVGLRSWPPVSFLASFAVLILVMIAVHGWPRELVPSRLTASESASPTIAA